MGALKAGGLARGVGWEDRVRQGLHILWEGWGMNYRMDKNVRHSVMLLSPASASLAIFSQRNPNAPEHPDAAWVAIMGPNGDKGGI